METHVGHVDDEFFVDLKGSSWLGNGVGRVDVIPAIGARSLDYPENVLAKLARSYLPIKTSSREDTGFTEQIDLLLRRMAKPEDYDIILIDARAGLHETTAASIIGLGANMLPPTQGLLFSCSMAWTRFPMTDEPSYWND